MKLAMREHTDAASGVENETAIVFEANAVAFYAQISGLAKDKIGYPIRELCTNAWDASRGRFDVQLPTRLRPVYRVRDYGLGMSDETMKRVYARLYASTKRASDTEVGGWGLGSKSPFAYLIGDDGAGQYQVTSIHEGMKRVYIMSLNAGGAPVMRLMMESPTTEASGLDVAFAVRQADIETFHQRAMEILWAFTPRPTVTPELKFPISRIEVCGETWNKFRRGTVPFEGPTVRMGCVTYPFDLDQIGINDALISPYEPVLFDAPIGSLSVNLSREQLGYDERTKQTLRSLVTNYDREYLTSIHTKILEATDMFHAARVLEVMIAQAATAPARVAITNLTWRDLPIHRRYTSGVETPFRCMLLRSGWTAFESFERASIPTQDCVDATVVIEHNPYKSLQRFINADLVGKKVLWVRCKRAQLEDTLKLLGQPDYIELDTYKVEGQKRDKDDTTKIRSRRVCALSDYGLTYDTRQVDLLGGGVYVHPQRLNRWSRNLQLSDSMSISDRAFDSVAQTLVQLGLVPSGTVILLRTDNDADHLSANWTWFGDGLTEKLRALVKPEMFTELYGKTTGSFPSELSKFMNAFEETRHLPDDVSSIVNDCKALYARLSNVVSNSNPDLVKSARAVRCLQDLGHPYELPAMQDPFSDLINRYEQFKRNYPVFDVLRAGCDCYYGRYAHASRGNIYTQYFQMIKKLQSMETTQGPRMIAAE